jgi:aquaporin Z
MDIRKLVAEAVGTAILVFFAVGVATLSFGFKFSGDITSAGVVATALAFGLVLMALAYAIGPISGAHVNPAVTIGFLVEGRISVTDAVGYWVAQIVGAIVGAALLRALFAAVPGYSTKTQGMGTNGWGDNSMVHLGLGGALLAEVLLTLLFVFVVLTVTRKLATPSMAGLALGLALSVVHLIGIPLTGTSVNPARSIGPALFVGGSALSQLWLFIVAPLIGGALAALLARYFYPGGEPADVPEPLPQQVTPPAQTATAAGRTPAAKGNTQRPRR